MKMSAAALTGAALAACGGGQAASPSRTAIVLVHGAWHGAWCFARVTPALTALGFTVVAADLPGHGLEARFPPSGARDGPRAGLATEVSPLAGITLDDYAASVIAEVDQARGAGFEKIVLVGHSMGGLAITRAGELAAAKIASLVYLAGHMPRSGSTMLDYLLAPEAATAKTGATLIGDPSVTGAFRIDPRSTDAAYLADLKLGYYNDASDDDFAAAGHLLTPDIPAGPMVTPLALTPAAWGALPRHYVYGLRDNAVPPPLALRMIADADAFAPANPTRVHTLDTGHSPFVTAPQALVALLARIAASP